MSEYNSYEIPAGIVLHDRYEIRSVIAQGGFGITYAAHDRQLDVQVCIKELFVSGNSTRSGGLLVQSRNLGEGFSFQDFVERFVTEARQLARFSHPNIVRVIDVFEANQTAYMVMEYVKGQTLQAIVSREGALSESRALTLIGQVLEAVDTVHQQGMLHRDIKPENILVSPEGRVVLIDFGSAREFAEGKTTTQTAMLTPGYAPIEQYSNRAQRGTYTDVYAIGATLYFMVTGEKPLAATDRVHEELPAPHQVNAAVSESTSSAIMMAMAMKAADRFQGISDVQAAMHLLQEAPVPDKTQATIPQTTPTPPPTKRTKRVGLSILLLAAGLLIVFVLAWLHSGYKGPEAASFESVAIGEQVWMARNLDVDRFRNGDPIPQAVTAADWVKARQEGKPAWCYYDNDSANGAQYGKLYNWFAIHDPRGLAPEGWVIPSYEEWTALADALGSSEGAKLKSTEGWMEDGNGNNESGFTGLPGGFRGDDGVFDDIRNSGQWWSATEYNTMEAHSIMLLYVGRGMSISETAKGAGLSVRCIKDNEALQAAREVAETNRKEAAQAAAQQQLEEQKRLQQQRVADSIRAAAEESRRAAIPTTLVDRSGNSYSVVAIGDRAWMAENLNTSKFRNGDVIPHVQDREAWLQAGARQQPAWCYYDNNSATGNRHGKLYNWYAVSDPRGLAPAGWRVATYEDFMAAGRNGLNKLAITYSGQRRPITMTVERNGDTRKEERDFSNLNEYAYWWTPTKGRYVVSNVSWSGLSADYEDPEWGYAVRCVWISPVTR